MTDAEMEEAVAHAQEYRQCDGVLACPCGSRLIARALIESQRQVEALTKERDAAVATERARVVEAIAAKLDYSDIERRLAKYIRTTDWAPPEENGNE